jgi:hypothetical protein
LDVHALPETSKICAVPPFTETVTDCVDDEIVFGLRAMPDEDAPAAGITSVTPMFRFPFAGVDPEPDPPAPRALCSNAPPPPPHEDKAKNPNALRASNRRIVISSDKRAV